MLENREERWKLSGRIASVFTPSAPVDEARLFAGRFDQVRDIINTVAQRGQHAIIYGERGVGKTSLANVLSDLLPDMGGTGWNSVIVNCDATTDFSSLWHQVAREMTMVVNTKRMGFGSDVFSTQLSMEAYMPTDVVPDDVRQLFQGFPSSTIVIVDELDRIKDKSATTLLADTVKTLSDHSVDVTLILVGVADSVDGLISEHRSIERALVQVRMPRMSNSELLEIIDKGMNEVGMSMEDEARLQITRLSQGLPHFTHSLSLYAAQQAAFSGRMTVIKDDVGVAVREAVEKTQQSIVSDYNAATSSPRETLFPQVLLACALAEKDQLGYFSAADVRKPMSNIMGKWYDIAAFSKHLNVFCEQVRGPILQKTGEKKRFRYRFVNPMMEPFVTMNGLANGLVTEDVLNGSL